MSGSQNIIDVVDGAQQEDLSSSSEVLVLKRQNASMSVPAGKEPWTTIAQYEEAMGSVSEYYEGRPPPEVPDLAAYFQQFDIDYDQEIRICRAYASYLAAQQPKKAKK